MRNIRYQKLADVQFVAGGGLRPPIDILRGVKTHALLFHQVIDFTVTVAGAAVVAEGLPRLISRLRLLENGEPRVDLTGRALSYVTSKAQWQAANIGALAGAGVQANTIVRADYVLDFASILGADPSETCFVERDSRFPVQLEFTFATNPVAELITGAPTAVLNSMTILTTQMYDPVSEVMPFFLPRIFRQQSNAIVGVQGNFPILMYPEQQNRVASLMLHGLGDGATNANFFTGQVTFRGDKFRYIDTVDFRSILNESRRFAPGVVPSAGYFPIESRFYGKLSEMYVNGQDDNLRVEAAVSLPGGVVTALFDCYRFEMEPVAGFTRALPPNW